MNRYKKSGYVKWCGKEIDSNGAPYECRHCEEPWWVWGLVWVNAKSQESGRSAPFRLQNAPPCLLMNIHPSRSHQ